MATINPYAGNVVHFPPGTPVSVMNAYIQAYTRNQDISQQLAYRQSQYDPWSETINQFQKQVLNPYLNEWLSQPFQDYRQTYNTNEQMRQQQALYDAQTQAKQQQALDEWQLAQQKASALGSAGGGLLDALQPEQMGPSPLQDVPPPPTPPTAPAIQPITQPQPATPMPDASQYDFGGAGGAPGGGYGGATDIGAGGGYGGASPYEGPPPLPSAAPAAAPMPPSAVAPTPPPNLPTPTPFQPYTPTLADALRTQAGASPLNAGLMMEALQKNPNLAGIMDPARQAALNAATLKAIAQGNLANANTELTAGKLQDLLATGGPRVQAILAAAGYKQAQAVTEQGKQATQQAEQDIITRYQNREISLEDAQNQIGLLTGKGPPKVQSPYTKTMQGAMAIVGSFPENQGKPEAEIVNAADRYLRDQATQDSANRARDTAAARAPAEIAKQGIKDIETQQLMFGQVQLHLSQLASPISTLADAGALPPSPMAIDSWETQLKRQMPEIWNQPGIPEAWGQVRQFYPSLIGSYDRAVLGLKGMRGIKDMYALVSDSTLLPAAQLQGAIGFMQTGMDGWQQAAQSRLQAYQTAIQTGSLSPIIGPQTPAGGAQPGQIHVQEKSSGRPGWIPVREFDPSQYTVIP